MISEVTRANLEIYVRILGGRLLKFLLLETLLEDYYASYSRKILGTDELQRLFLYKAKAVLDIKYASAGNFHCISSQTNLHLRSHKTVEPSACCMLVYTLPFRSAQVTLIDFTLRFTLTCKNHSNYIGII